MTRTPSAPISVLRYDVDKFLYFVLEFSIHLPLTSQIKVGRESKTIYFVVAVVVKISSGEFSGEEKREHEILILLALGGLKGKF